MPRCTRVRTIGVVDRLQQELQRLQRGQPGGLRHGVIVQHLNGLLHGQSMLRHRWGQGAPCRHERACDWHYACRQGGSRNLTIISWASLGSLRIASMACCAPHHVVNSLHMGKIALIKAGCAPGEPSACVQGRHAQLCLQPAPVGSGDRCGLPDAVHTQRPWAPRIPCTQGGAMLWEQ
jgi:hypothetical protein